MEELELKHIENALERINKYIPYTPLEASYHLSDENRNVYLKLECNQPIVHAFKIRGALNKLSILGKDVCEKGIGAISSGNHGVAVSCAAKMMGFSSPEIVIPKNTAKAKVDLIKFLGGTVVFKGETYDDAHILGEEYFKKDNKTIIDAYFMDKDIFAGQGSIALEILKQKPEIDTIVVPIGGGGLIGGIATAVKKINPNIRVIGVQTSACPAMLNSIKDNVCYTEYLSENSICTALIGGVGIRGFEICKKYVDDIILVEENEILLALKYAILNEHHLIEPSSAVTIAAELFHKKKIGGKNIALVISGGNIDGDMIKKAIL